MSILNMGLISQKGTLLSLRECDVKHCTYSKMVYNKNAKLCEGAAICPHFKKEARITKKLVKAAKSEKSEKEQG
jgi:hypothetical protein